MRNKTLSKKLQYIHDLFSITDTDVVSIHQLIQDHTSLMQLSLIEGQILQLLIKMNNIKSIIEIGTFVGSSAMCMVKALPENGHIYTIEKNTTYAELAKNNFEKHNLSHKVTVINDMAIPALNKLTGSPFDMVFIDANKSEYCDYLDWAESNIKKNGLIIADNTLLFGNVYFDNNITKKVSKTTIYQMRSFNKRLSDKNKYLTVLLPTEEGMTIALKLF